MGWFPRFSNIYSFARFKPVDFVDFFYSVDLKDFLDFPFLESILLISSNSPISSIFLVSWTYQNLSISSISLILSFLIDFVDIVQFLNITVFIIRQFSSIFVDFVDFVDSVDFIKFSDINFFTFFEFCEFPRFTQWKIV